MTASTAPRPGTTQLRVGRLTKAHGLKGALKIELYTDDPERRFTPGAIFALQVPTSSPWHGKTLELAELRWYNGHALYREYRDVVGQFTYVVETERRFYLANEVTLERRDTEHDFYFELQMNDVWVWDVYRSDRFVKSVRVLTFKDVNVEVRGDKDLELPKELALDE